MLRNAAKILSIAIVLAMVLGAFAVIAPAFSASPAPAAQTETKIVDVEPMYAGTEYRYQDLDVGAMYSDFNAVNGEALAAPGNIYQNGSIARYYVGSSGKWAYNATNPTGYMLFQKRTETTHCEIWTATDLMFPAGDPRNAKTSQITINNSQAQYMADHFETVIYPNMTAFFGAPPQIDGENSVPKSQGRPYFGTNVTGRAMIMVFNIVDESFFDFNYPSYVVGYFSSSMDSYYDRNIVHIDCFDWQNRTTGESARPWVYESTIAHEWQHLLNDFFNPGQISFVNEGCSMFAEIVCGYGIDISYIQTFFFTPDNSLVDWGDQGGINILADYGAAALFTAWLADHFGGEMVQAMVHSEGTSGIDTINFAFGEIEATGWDFNKAFLYWRLANLIQSDTPGNGWFNYDSIDVSAAGSPRVYPWWAEYGDVDSGGEFFGPTGTNRGYFTGIRNLGAYGTDYIEVVSMGPSAPSAPSITLPWSYDLNPNELKFVFQGDAESAKGWQMTSVPLDVGDAVYSENFNHGGSFPTGWSAASVASPGGGPWYMENLGSGNYQASVNGWSSPADFDPAVYQYERLFSQYIDLEDVNNAQLSFDMNFEMGTPYDYCRIRISAVSSMDTSWQTYYLWAEDVDDTITFDVSDLTGWTIQFRIDFLTWGGDASMSIDNFVVNEVSSTMGWWSDRGDQIDYSLYTDLDLTEMEEAILTLDMAWDIEAYWDFGFVQVSADGGESWTSVANEYTTTDYDSSAMPEIVENLPGITDSSGGYVLTSWDLSEWAGQMVKVRLRYMTDWGTNLVGWFVKGADLNGEAIAMDAWVSDSPPMTNHWLVTLYFPGAVGLESQVYMLPIMTTLTLDETTQMVIRTMNAFLEYSEMYILVSPMIGNADYSMFMGNAYTEMMG